MIEPGMRVVALDPAGDANFSGIDLAAEAVVLIDAATRRPVAVARPIGRDRPGPISTVNEVSAAERAAFAESIRREAGNGAVLMAAEGRAVAVPVEVGHATATGRPSIVPPAPPPPPTPADPRAGLRATMSRETAARTAGKAAAAPEPAADLTPPAVAPSGRLSEAAQGYIVKLWRAHPDKSAGFIASKFHTATGRALNPETVGAPRPDDLPAAPRHIPDDVAGIHAFGGKRRRRGSDGY